MRGIAKQHDIVMVPGLRFECGEADPPGIVREQDGSMQITGKQVLAIGQALRLVGLVQARVVHEVNEELGGRGVGCLDAGGSIGFRVGASERKSSLPSSGERRMLALSTMTEHDSGHYEGVL